MSQQESKHRANSILAGRKPEKRSSSCKKGRLNNLAMLAIEHRRDVFTKLPL